MTTDQPTRLHRALIARELLRAEPLRVEELARRLDERPRTIERILVTIREVGEWCRAHGLPWYEIQTETRGRERWHRIVDHKAEPKRGRSHD